jgi:nucleotide-binding universal stress UspA family protein
MEILMPLIKKILFPVDFSDSCLGAARYVEAFAGRFEAEIKLLHVVGMGEHTLAEELLPGRRRQLDAFLADELKYFSTERVCVTGDAASEIVDAARRWSPDLVMMPTHRLGSFRRLLIGSVTAKVLHDLDCPVWTSAHVETAPPLEQIHCRRVLCAVDLAEGSRSLLEWVAWLVNIRPAWKSSTQPLNCPQLTTDGTSEWSLCSQFRSRRQGEWKAFSGRLAQRVRSTSVPELPRKWLPKQPENLMPI